MDNQKYAVTYEHSDRHLVCTSATKEQLDKIKEILSTPKPLLSDAQVGWLCTNRIGHTSRIKYVDDNKGVLKYAYEVSDGTTVYVRENGKFNIIDHDSNLDIIHTEPLAKEGSAKWALQQMKLGNLLCRTNHALGCLWKLDRDREGEVVYKYSPKSDKWELNASAEAWAINADPTGWQLYETQPKFKVGDWVEVDYYNEHRIARIKHIELSNITYKLLGAHEWKTNKNVILRIIHKSEVKITLTLEGTVSALNSYGDFDVRYDCGDNDYHVININALSPAQAALVRELVED